MKYLFRNYLIDSSAAFVDILSELNSLKIYDAMAVIRSVPSQPAWEDLFKILIKVYKLKKSTEIILVFDSYTDELQYSLKEQETASLQTHISEISQKMPQDKNYQEFLSNTRNKSELLKKVTEYFTHEKIRKDFMGRTTLNIEKDTVLISQS